jgi:hypothetical protein
MFLTLSKLTAVCSASGKATKILYWLGDNCANNSGVIDI